MREVTNAEILARLVSIDDGLATIKTELRELNGTVRQNQQDIAVLNATALKLDVVKISAIIGGVLVVVAALMKFAGLL